MTEPAGYLERLLKRDSANVIASLVAITLLAWIYLIVLALDMARGAGSSRTERRGRWRATAREGFSEEEFAAATAEMHLTLGTLDHALAGAAPWLLGEMYSLADIAMVPFIERIIDLEPDIVDAGAYGAVTDWLARYRNGQPMTKLSSSRTRTRGSPRSARRSASTDRNACAG